jgi:hypothetical protein
MPLTRLVLGGPVIDGFEGLPSTWIATESLGFNRPAKPATRPKCCQFWGASQRDPILQARLR